MAFWEFLLQKEGDRSWLPLESSKVEILEGRYRIVAHSDRSNVPVEIRVTHDATAEIPPIRRTQKRHSRTNKDGLVVVMPFTRLLPGIWDLRCASDVMADMLGEGWQHAVQLQVLSFEAESGDDWDLDWQGTENTEDTESAIPVAQATSQAEVAAVSSAPISIEPELKPESKPEVLEPKILKPETPAIAAAAETEVQSEGQSGDRAMAETEPLASNLLPLVPRSAAETTDTTAASEETKEVKAYSESAESVELVASSTVSKAPQPHLSQSHTSQPAFREPITLQYPNSGICLRLGQETYIIQREQPLTLMGQVELLDQQLVYDLLPVGALKVRLSDPQTSQILVDERQPLTAQRVPFPFTCQITLPKHYQTYLLLGELILYGDAPEAPDQDPPILATQSFTVTTDLHELLEAIANDFAQSDLPAPKGSSTGTEETDAQNVVFLNPTKIPAQVQFRPASPRTLPPQLHPPDPAKLPRSPQLPAFPQATTAKVYQPEDLELLSTVEPAHEEAEVVSVPESSAAGLIPDEQVADEQVADRPVTEEAIAAPPAIAGATELQAADIEITETLTNALEATQTTLNDTQPTDIAIADSAPFTAPQTFDDAPIPDWDRQEDHSPQQHSSETTDRPPGSPEDAAFRSLNLQERFWTRLQSLVSDRELFELDDLVPADAGSLTEARQDSSASEGSQVARAGQQGQYALGLDADLVSQEVVAEDELRPQQLSAEQPPIAVPQERSVLVLPDEEPIPVPQLEVRPHEPVAGETLEILVRLPDLPTRLFVKLWLRDRQNRSILDGPQWLMGFLPDGFGRLTARTTSTIPQDCLEIQIEAIAVEIASSRESDKASLTRQVVLPDLPSLSLDELDM